MRALLALLIGLIVVAGCGGDDDGGGGGGAAASACPSDAVTIEMADIKFQPETTTVKAGQEVCWVNEDSVQHNAVAESGADFKSELFNKGETFTTTVEEPGTVKYVCTVHPGMTGTLEVK